jgi:hypothetical protein
MPDAAKPAAVSAVTQHAIDRYMERTGAKKAQRATTTLFCLAESAIPIGKNRYYARGWIVVVKDGVVKTAYRPKTREQMDAVYCACSTKNLI